MYYNYSDENIESKLFHLSAMYMYTTCTFRACNGGLRYRRAPHAQNYGAQPWRATAHMYTSTPYPRPLALQTHSRGSCSCYSEHQLQGLSLELEETEAHAVVRLTTTVHKASEVRSLKSKLT